MSYCRFSTDDFQCDVYAYEDVRGGWTICVAATRSAPGAWAHAFDGLGPVISGSDALAAVKAVRVDLLNLPSAGERFNEPTLRAFRDRMTALREEGFRFPDNVFEQIDEEIAAQ